MELVLLAFGFSGFVWLNMTFERRLFNVEKSLKNELLKAMDDKFVGFHKQLKENDFAHLNSTIEALTFTLEKNKFLTSEDKTYIDGRLDK